MRVRLLREQCATCILRPGNLMHLSDGRLAELVRANLDAGTLVTCHDTLPYGDHPEVGEALCRGYFDAYADRTAVVAKMRAVFGTDAAWLEEVDPPS